MLVEHHDGMTAGRGWLFMYPYLERRGRILADSSLTDRKSHVCR